MENIELRQYLRNRLLELKDEDVYIDVGACIGAACILMDKGTCYAFEPSTRNYNLLVENTWVNKNIKPINKALYSSELPYLISEQKIIGMDKISIINESQYITTFRINENNYNK